MGAKMSFWGAIDYMCLSLQVMSNYGSELSYYHSCVGVADSCKLLI